MELSNLPVGKLLRQGSVIGGGVLGVVVLLLITIAVQWRMAVQRRSQLATFAIESDQLQLQVDSTEADLTAAETLNRAVAEAVAGVRSGSALLTESTLR